MRRKGQPDRATPSGRISHCCALGRPSSVTAVPSLRTEADKIMTRFPTTLDGLDDILQGGLFEGGVYILEGPPGVGKTTFANQMAYNYAASGKRTLYVTMLSESHTRMVQHMEKQTFFNRASVNSSVLYLSGYRELEEGGLKAVVSMLRSELHRSGASMLVVDGLVVSAPDIDEGVRQFVHELQSLITAMNCTCLLLTSGRGNALSAEQTMVDGIFTFQDRQFRGRAERIIQVCKFRGSQVLRGQHSFCITNDGLKFFPRLETLSPGKSSKRALGTVACGVTEIDEVLASKGLAEGTTTLVMGASGAGKTLLGFRFASGVSRSQPGLMLLGAPNTPDDALALSAQFGIPMAHAVHEGHLYVDAIGQADESLDEMGHRILRLIDETGAHRFVLDSIAALADTSAFADRGYRFVGRLLSELRRRQVTTLITLDPAELAVASGTSLATGVSALFDNVFHFEAGHDATAARRMAIQKIRGSRAAASTVTFDI